MFNNATKTNMEYRLNSQNCCRYCGKNYMKKTNLEKHIILCEFLKKSSNSHTIDDEEPPSQKKIYKILLELGLKYNKLEERLNELDKWVVKKKKKINIIEWLNSNIVPTISFNSLIEHISINNDDIDYLFKRSFADTLDYIFARTIYLTRETPPFPIFASSIKQNVFYVFENSKEGWIECTKPILSSFLNRVHMKLHRVFVQWKKDNATQIFDDENLSILCDKTSVKLLDVDLRQETTFSKIKCGMYAKMKMDVKYLVEYEIEG